jgi:hypothetical protein
MDSPAPTNIAIKARTNTVEIEFHQARLSMPDLFGEKSLMVPDEGLEPPTFGLQNRCSTN